MKTLNAWLDWQLDQYPSEIDLGLKRVHTVWQRLYSQPLKAQVITVAGTNGKGSTVALLESILKQSKVSVGAYSSPHLMDYNERIRINGEMVDDLTLCDAFSEIKKACSNDIKLTYFEYATLAALKIFTDAQVTVFILEVGLGGRLDAVNIIDADIAIITSIDIDHQSWLGNDREAIGYQKAGIFRANKPAIYGGLNPPLSLLEYAKTITANLICAQQDYQFEINQKNWSLLNKKLNLTALPYPALVGDKQVQNAAAAINALIELDLVNIEAIKKGLQQVQLAGRFQIINTYKVPLILDVAHNPQAADCLAKNLAKRPIKGQRIAVFAMLADKEVNSIVKILAPWIDHWYLAGLQVERGLSVNALAKKMPYTLKFKTVETALKQGFKGAQKDDEILVFGSFYTVSQALQFKG